MKNTMNKMLMIALAMASVSVTAQAQIMGGRTIHVLGCGAPKLNGRMVLGISYSLTCETQAVAPENSLRDCALSSRPVAPDAKSTPIAIHQQSQDASKAMFIGRGVTVKVNKTQLTAKIIMENGAVASCAEVTESK